MGDQFRHAFETKVRFHRLLWRCRCAAATPHPPVNPRRRQADGLGRHVVVEEALCDVQDAAGSGAEVRRHSGEQEFKVGQRWFVRADFLGGKNRVPRIAEAGSTSPVAGAVAVGEGD